MKRMFATLAILLGLCTGIMAFDTTKTPPEGTVVTLDRGSHIENSEGSDGGGLCVPTSVVVAARWQGIKEAEGFLDYCRHRPGGSTPLQLARDLKAYAAKSHVTLPPFLQHTGGDVKFLEEMLKAGKCVGITYCGNDGFYKSTINHMVDLAGLTETTGVIIDSNRPHFWVSMTRSQLIARWQGKRDDGRPALLLARYPWGEYVWLPATGGWAFVWLDVPQVAPAPRPVGVPGGRYRYWIGDVETDREDAETALVAQYAPPVPPDAFIQSCGGWHVCWWCYGLGGVLTVIVGLALYGECKRANRN